MTRICSRARISLEVRAWAEFKEGKQTRRAERSITHFKAIEYLDLIQNISLILIIVQVLITKYLNSIADHTLAKSRFLSNLSLCQRGVTGDRRDMPPHGTYPSLG